MIRPGKSSDAFALAALLGDLHMRTIYNGLVMDGAYARKLFAQFAHRHGGTHDGATCLFVCEQDEKLVGFVAGALDRVYHVGDDLWATDVYLSVHDDAPATASLQLLKAYIGWAEQNAQVFEVRLSSSYATESGREIGTLYERLGFEECGRVYRRANPNFVARERRAAA